MNRVAITTAIPSLQCLRLGHMELSVIFCRTLQKLCVFDQWPDKLIVPEEPETNLWVYIIRAVE